MNSTRETLIAARALIEQGWCQGHFAKDARGVPIASLSESACNWCMVGAVKRAVGSLFPAIDTLLEANAFNCIGELEDWNDAPERTQAEVLEAFDKAIAECGE